MFLQLGPLLRKVTINSGTVVYHKDKNIRIQINSRESAGKISLSDCLATSIATIGLANAENTKQFLQQLFSACTRKALTSYKVGC